FVDRHMGEQSRRRDTLVDRLRGKGCGVHRLAVPAAVLGTDVTANEEARRDEIELLADLLADSLQVLPAVGTGVEGESVANLDTRQRIGQRPALGRLLGPELLLALAAACHRFQPRFDLGDVSVELTLPQGKLFDRERLGALAEAPAPQACNLEGQLL